MSSRTGFDVLRGSDDCCYERVPDPQQTYTDSVVAPLLSEISDKLAQARPPHPRQFMSSYLGGDTFYVDMIVFDQCVYFFSAVSAAMFLLWIGWMPLLKFVVPGMHKETDTPTTTISDTFSNYNVVATIYITGPLCVLFLLRIYTTLRCEYLSGKEQTKKFVCILLLLSQYSMFVVIRFDAIRGNAHVVATFMTFFLLIMYHTYTHNAASMHGGNVWGCPTKLLLGIVSTVCILMFACLVFWVDNPDKYSGLWTIATVLEIIAVLFLGAMDMIDIYDLGSRLVDTHSDHTIELPLNDTSHHHTLSQYA